MRKNLTTPKKHNFLAIFRTLKNVFTVGKFLSRKLTNCQFLKRNLPTVLQILKVFLTFLFKKSVSRSGIMAKTAIWSDTGYRGIRSWS